MSFTKKLIDTIFEMSTYINGVLASYEDKLWLTTNLLIDKEFLKKIKLVNHILYVETI